MNLLNNVVVRQHNDGTWDFYIFAAENGEQLAHSNQHYEHSDECAKTASRVTNPAVPVHFTYQRKAEM